MCSVSPVLDLAPAGARSSREVNGRIKGTVLIDCVKALRHFRDDAASFLSSERARALVLGNERVLAASWYDETLAFELYRTFARVRLGGAGVRVWHQMGRLASRAHAEAAYKHLVKARETTRIMTEGAVLLFSAQHDTGKLTSQVVRANEVRVEVKGFGAMCPEWRHMIAGYLVGLAEATGAEQVNVLHHETDPRAKDASYTVTWLAPAAG
jgi:hypothetical protein